uniref:Uncharacterized protein n=1 Tax=Anguilla anguilla TaxID=7936 RepID=A0A0E9VNP9_ANGAN
MLCSISTPVTEVTLLAFMKGKTTNKHTLTLFSHMK